MLNSDYKDILRALLDEDAEFLVVGAYAMATYGYPRATVDIDIWVRPSLDNAEAVLRALKRFGAPLHTLTIDDLRRNDTVFQIGVAPRRIDILTGATGLAFEGAYKRSIVVDFDGIRARVPALKDLIRNKKASGRAKDLADAEALGRLGGDNRPKHSALRPNRPPRRRR